jgi:hypothetical protein
MENRIKEQFSLFADRVSTETMRANQMRLYLSAMAYVLVSGLRRLGLKATELATAQVSTIRTKLLKIGAQIRVTARKVWVSMASSYPWQDLYRQVWTNLTCRKRQFPTSSQTLSSKPRQRRSGAVRWIEIRVTEKRFFSSLGAVSPLIQRNNHDLGNESPFALWKSSSVLGSV